MHKKYAAPDTAQRTNCKNVLPKRKIFSANFPLTIQFLPRRRKTHAPFGVIAKPPAFRTDADGTSGRSTEKIALFEISALVFLVLIMVQFLFALKGVFLRLGLRDLARVEQGTDI